MSTLTLVRHGQARPFEDDSDRLSETGELQCRLLGEYWTRHHARFDLAVSGSLNRHRQSEAQVRAAGCELPESRIDPGWNEYDADGILRRLAPELVAHDATFAARKREYDSMAPGADRNRYFQRMFEVLMNAWLTGAVEAEGVEPFPVYQGRVLEAFERLRTESNRNIVVFTSGGPIGLMVRHALGAPSKAFLDVNWRIRNASLTEFTFSRDRLSLDTMNGLPHLDSHRELRTWR